MATFGGLDIVVNNASAISLTDSQATDMKRFDLMHQINTRGTFMVSKFAVPHLEKSANPHILTLSPPLDMKEKWFAPYTAYAMAKFGMSLVVLGLAGELRRKGIAVNALWPRTVIATAAVQNLLGGDAMMRSARTPQIIADAARMIFMKDAKAFSGHFSSTTPSWRRTASRLRGLSRRSERGAGPGFLRAGRQCAAASLAAVATRS